MDLSSYINVTKINRTAHDLVMWDSVIHVSGPDKEDLTVMWSYLVFRILLISFTIKSKEGWITGKWRFQFISFLHVFRADSWQCFENKLRRSAGSDLSEEQRLLQHCRYSEESDVYQLTRRSISFPEMLRKDQYYELLNSLGLCQRFSPKSTFFHANFPLAFSSSLRFQGRKFPQNSAHYSSSCLCALCSSIPSWFTILQKVGDAKTIDAGREYHSLHQNW